jgi:DNA-binding PadR family transcriptional regulator
MSLRHAILTALLEQPSSGFDLVGRFDKSIRYFWSATHQQIYQELRKLEIEGLVNSTPQPGTRGNRKLYEVLTPGRTELEHWVSTYEEPRPTKDAMLLRLRAASVVGLSSLLDQLREHHEAHRAQRDEYLSIAERDFTSATPGDTERIQRLILQAGIGLEQFWMEWIESTREELQEIAETDEQSREEETAK